MKQRYKSGNIFTDVKIEKFPRHKFNKGYFNRFTCNHGKAIPFFCKDVLPGDRFDLSTFGRVQLMPLATSMMQNIRVYFRYFYVPYRLLWENWDKFMTQEDNELSFAAPNVILDSAQLNTLKDKVGGLHDMLGLNLYNPQRMVVGGSALGQLYTTDAKLQFNLFRWAAYHLIWDYYFRDENLQDPVFVPLEDGSLNNDYNHTRLSTLLPVAYEKDYFTTALPWPQKGDPVNLSAYVYSNSSSYWLSDGETSTKYGLFSGSNFDPVYRGGRFDVVKDDAFIGQVEVEEELINTSLNGKNPAYIDHLSVPDGQATKINVPLRISDEAYATSFNINDLRYSNALQRFLERKALGGSRPAEFYLSMYGVRVDDLRIGQPLYLGGGYSNVSVTDVTQMSQTTDGNPLGTLAGNGKSFPAMKINNPYYAQEFGVVMGIMYIRPEINYSQGLPREMQLFETLDFYNPVFAHLGEEAVLTSELYIKPDINNVKTGTYSEDNNDETFGYQSRYAYLKHSRNEVHGQFKTTLSKWMLSLGFSSTPTLSDEFITVDQNYDIFSVTSANEDHYLIELYNDYQVESSMPNFVIPSL